MSAAASTLVYIDRRARAAWPFLPVLSQPDRFYQGPLGELVRVRSDGGAEPVLASGHPRGGIAADPAPGRRPAAQEPR